MELIGKLKQKVENAAGKEEIRELIEEAGVKLTDEELEQVSGGNVFTDPPKFVPEARPKKPQG